MTTDTYAHLLTRIQALAGVDTFLTAELTLIDSFINRRAYQAYRYSDNWPRYFVAAEARPGPLNIIPFAYTASDGNRNISTATRSGYTVTITTTADIDGDFVTGQTLTMASLTYSTVNPNGAYVVTVSGDRTFTYDLADTTLTSSETYGGSGTVVPVALTEVDTFIRVFNSFPYNLQGAGEYEIFVQSDGCHVMGNSTSAPGFYVCYKKVWDGPYNNSSNDDIPREQFDYIAHAAYADFLRMDRQNDKAIAEEQVALQYLMVELERPQNQANSQLTSRISTYVSKSNR